MDNNIEDAPTTNIYPDSGWVEANFKPELLGTAQQVAIDFFEPIKVKGEEAPEHGFINVEDQGVQLPLDDGELNRLRYIPGRKSKNKKQDIPAKWFGYYNKTKQKVLLDEKYVLDNFTEDIIADVKKIALMGDKKFIDIPPGDAKKQEIFPANLEKGPKMKQGRIQESICVWFILLQVHCITLEKNKMLLKFMKSQRNLLNAMIPFNNFPRQLGNKMKSTDSPN